MNSRKPSLSNLIELKSALAAGDFEIYRTVDQRVLLAERVRDNLIMDSGVAAVAGNPLRASVTFRARSSDFPGETSERLYSKARLLAAKAGIEYSEVDAQRNEVLDPGDSGKVLDTWYEVVFERTVDDPPALFEELTRLLSIPKTAG